MNIQSNTNVMPPIHWPPDEPEKETVALGWERLLEESVNSIRDNQRSRYIVLENHDLKITDSLGGNKKKLTIDQIIQISKECMKNEVDLFLTDRKIDVDECLRYRDHVRDLTEKLIDARAEKRTHNYLRNAVRKLAFAASFILIGIPFYIALKQGDNKFAQEIRSLKNELSDRRKE